MKKILLIEDNDDVRENTAEILALAQYDVLTAENGRIGVELAQKHRPDLIICDIMMPVLDGHGVLHLLGRNEATAGIPFIFLTAKAERGDVRKGMEMGADDYLTKPFDDVELLNAIEVRLKKHDALRKEFMQDRRDSSAFPDEAKGTGALEKLSEAQEVRTYPKKSEIFREGTYPKGIYCLRSGKVKVFQKNAQGKELITALHTAGDFFGFPALLKDEPYVHSAVALEDSEIYLLSKDDFFALLHKNADVARKFIGLLSDNVLEKEQQLIELAYNSVRKRVAQALLKLAASSEQKTGQAVILTVSREDLANLAGTATETVIRTLADFREEQYIGIAGGTITIFQPEKLAALKN
jgi:CRP-like cAMP-binding protein/CheY-like chemotaxis protein